MNSLITKLPEIDRVFDQLWRGSYARGAQGDGEQFTLLRPRVDVLESDKDFRVVVDLPGVKKDDLRVEVENNVLTIAAERSRKESDDLQALHVERAWNARFERSFTLGQSVEADKIKARFKDGVLELSIPKSEKALPRRINVE